jgi:iron complex outermembrane receptor protein
MTKTLRRAALLASFSPLAFASVAAAQQNQEVAQTPQAQEASETPTERTIVVTGTRRSDRTVADSPVPVDVIGSDAIANTGQTETNRILNQLVPSFNFPQPAIADGSDALRPATLRGLGPDQTLVLINGKRRHVSALLNINGTVGRGSAAVDMNLIPGLAISRVEVLRDGAAAQYGSDAIAGVINVQLKSAKNGGRVSMTYGEYYTTIAGVPKVTGLALTATGQPQFDPADQPPVGNPRYLLANTDGERKVNDGPQLTLGANLGIPLGPNGFVNITGELRERARTNRAGYDLRPNYVQPTSTTFDPREISFDRLQFRFGDPETSDYNLFVNSGFEVGGGWELYGFGSFGRRDSLSAANYRQAGAAANRNFEVLAPNQSPNAGNFVALTPNGFLPLIDTELKDLSGVGGIRGEVGPWNLDFSVGHGRNAFDYTLRNSLNTSFGTASQRTFNAGGLRYNQTIFNADVSREMDLGFAKPLSIAFGAEHRRENFEVRPGDFQSYARGPLFFPPVPNTTQANCNTLGGVFNLPTSTCNFPGRAPQTAAQGFPGIPARSATDRGRHSFAGYVELDTDIIENLTTTIAARAERFSDFGSTLNGKFAARYEPVEGYAVRGSVSNGFRAPSLHQQFYTGLSTNFIGGLPVDILTVAVDDPIARALGSKDLKPEKSVNLSLGATANPFRGLTLTLDWYRIKIKDRVVLSENLGAAGSGTTAVNNAVNKVLDDNGFENVDAARFFFNGLDTTTRGIDAVASYRMNAGDLGTWNLTAAYNRNKNKIDRRFNELGPLATIPGIILFGRVEGIRFEQGQPKDKIVLSGDGDFGALGLTARTTRYGKVVSPGSVAPLAPNATSLTAYGPDDMFLGAKWITDLEVRYRAGGDKAAEFALGANNVFDIYPDRFPFGQRPASLGGGSYPANQQYIPFSVFSPFGFNGRYLYGRVSVNF